MNCSQARILIHAGLDGELDDRARRRLDRHLKTCTDCSAMSRGLDTTLRLAATVAVSPTPPSDLASTVAARLRRRRRYRLLMGTGIAAAVLLLCLLLRPGERPAGPSQTVPPTTGLRTDRAEATVAWSERGADVLNSAWRRAVDEINAVVRESVAESFKPEDTYWQHEIESAGKALKELTREITCRMLPGRRPQADPRSGNS